MQSNTILRDVGNTEKLMGNNNNLNNNGSPGADIMFQMEDDSLTQLGSVFQSAYQSIVGGSAQVREILNVILVSASRRRVVPFVRGTCMHLGTIRPCTLAFGAGVEGKFDSS